MNKVVIMKKKKNYLFIFIFCTLVWTWISGFIPIIFGIENETVKDILFKVLAGPAPSIMGLILVFSTYSKKDIKDYFKRCFSFKQMGIALPILIMLIYAFICALSILVSTKIFNGSIPEFSGIKTIIDKPYMIFMFIFFALISGPINEEFGWRGYALDPLIKKYGF